MEKAREEELKIYKLKYQKNSTHKENNDPMNSFMPNPKTIEIFKTNIVNECKELKKSYLTLSEKSLKPEEVLSNSKRLYDTLKKDNEELNRKV